MLLLAPIVEGHGEGEAVPALLHRIAQVPPVLNGLRINPPIRVKSGSFLNDRGYFSRYVTLAAAKARQQNGVVLILLDCDDDCPAKLGPDLLRRAKEVSPDVPALVALAYREYESWFVTACRSLRGHGLRDDADVPRQMDRLRNAKGWLSERMSGGYDPVTHQLRFTRIFDISAARADHSFDRFYRHIRRLLAASSPA